MKVCVSAGRGCLEGYTPAIFLPGDRGLLLDAADNSIDEIASECDLETLSIDDAVTTIADWARALKPGGKLDVEVFNGEAFAQDMVTGVDSAYRANQSLGPGIRTFFSEELLRQLLLRHGLVPKLDHSRQIDRVRLVCTKRKFEIKQRPRVLVVYSWPRLCPTDCVLSITRAVREFAMKRNVDVVENDVGGAFWDKAMQMAGSNVADGDYDYGLFIDFDTVIPSGEDLCRLFDIMQERDDLAALWPLQISRHNDFPLCYNPVNDYSTDITVQPIGHFGATFVRGDVFRQLPKPWFLMLVDPSTGEYPQNGRGDSDIVFWESLAEYGFKVAQCNTVQCGHAEMGVRWIVKKGRAIVPTQVWRTAGAPPNRVDWDAVRQAWIEHHEKKRAEADVQRMRAEHGLGWGGPPPEGVSCP